MATALSAPKLLTLVFVLGQQRVLLGMKKRGFGAGKWNGFGGKKEERESLRACARRELLEETSLDAPEDAFKERGFLSFVMESDGMVDKAADTVSSVLHVFVYSVPEAACTGSPTESEEMAPQWYPHAEVPFESMWLDDPIWLPQLLADETGEVCFNVDISFESEGSLRDDWKMWNWASASEMQRAFELEAETGEPGSSAAAAVCGGLEDGTCPHDRSMGDVAQLLWPSPGKGVEGLSITGTAAAISAGGELEPEAEAGGLE